MKIGVVIVTYNRLEKLKIALSSFENQTFKPVWIVIVNNCSTDGTDDFLKNYVSKSDLDINVITTESNLGGSGGFYRGLKEALKFDADWIWVSDDDAFPYQDALECADAYLRKHSTENISAIAAEVINHGKIDYGHRRTAFEDGIKIIELPSNEEDYKKESFEINEFSYVGSIISTKHLREAGLTEKNYFIWCDDTEHSLRLSNVGKIVCVPSIKVQHDVASFQGGLSWKDYYGWRNSIDMYSKHFSSKTVFFLYIRHYLKALYYLVIKHDVPYYKMYYSAIKDARKHRLGIHEIYRPGWKLED